MTSAVAEVPSNIALVKYWGKRDAARQWPANDSLSMTLSTARTRTTAAITAGAADTLAGNAGDPAKGLAHLARLRTELGFDARLGVETSNSFPARCGIASSASGLGALTLAAVAAWTGAGSLLELADAGYSLERLAGLARLGSGSACRSFHGGFVYWEAGQAPEAQRVVPLGAAWDLADVIVLVSTSPKDASSTAGHGAAWGSPLFLPRLAGLPDRLAAVKDALARRDIESLGAAIEADALEMHAVMMSGTPAIRYFGKDTADLLSWVRRERAAGSLPAYFTLDAGPNVHLICARAHAPSVASRLKAAFPDYQLILDEVGKGPTLTRIPTRSERP